MSKPALTLLDEWHWHRGIARPIDDADNAVRHGRCDSGFVPIVFHLNLELMMKRVRQQNWWRAMDSYTVNQLKLDAPLGGDLDPDDASLDVVDRTRNVGQRHAQGGMLSKQMRFWSHADAAHMFLEPVS